MVHSLVTEKQFYDSNKVMKNQIASVIENAGYKSTETLYSGDTKLKDGSEVKLSANIDTFEQIYVEYTDAESSSTKYPICSNFLVLKDAGSYRVNGIQSFALDEFHAVSFYLNYDGVNKKKLTVNHVQIQKISASSGNAKFAFPATPKVVITRIVGIKANAPAEISDARVSVDGTVYETLGEAIREQIKQCGTVAATLYNLASDEINAADNYCLIDNEVTYERVQRYKYNDTYLPKLPDGVNSENCFIRKNDDSGYYDLIVANDASNVYANADGSVNTGSNAWYRFSQTGTDYLSAWTYYKTDEYTNWKISDTRPMVFAGLDIKNEAGEVVYAKGVITIC